MLLVRLPRSSLPLFETALRGVHRAFPALVQVPSPGLLVGAASPARLTTRQGTRAGGLRQGCRAGGRGSPPPSAAPGGLGLDGAPPRARVAGSQAGQRRAE